MKALATLLASGWFLLAAALLPAASDTPSTEEKGTYLGVLFCPITEALYDHLPQLPRNQGVLLTHVLPDSPAARSDLRRHDILLQYDDVAIRDCEHLVRLIQNDKPNRKVKFQLLRGGREMSLDIVLGLGPKLKIAQANKTPPTETAEGPRAVAKPGGPPAVTVSATPLEQGKLKVTIEYFHEESGRYRTLKCEGQAEDIAQEVQKLPERERQLVNVALKRLKDRAFTSPKHQP